MSAHPNSLSSLNIPSVSIFIVAFGTVEESDFSSDPFSSSPNIVTLFNIGLVPSSSNVYRKSLYVILYINDVLELDVSMSDASVWDGNVSRGDIILKMNCPKWILLYSYPFYY